MKPHIEVDSPIHRCLTLAGDGGATARRQVFCKRSNETVRTSACAECPYAVAWPATSMTDPEAAIRCRTDAPMPPTADSGERAMRTAIGEVMQRRLVCVREDADMETLGRLLAEDSLDAVPVVDALGHPKGIVCKTDLLRALRDRDDLTADEVMTPFVHALHEGAPLSFALAMLALEDIEQIPVVSKDGVVVGVLASRDAIRWMARELGYSVPGTKHAR